jgi:hypothetical protein
MLDLTVLPIVLSAIVLFLVLVGMLLYLYLPPLDKPSHSAPVCHTIVSAKPKRKRRTILSVQERIALRITAFQLLRKGYSQREISEKLCVDKSVVSRLLAGEQRGLHKKPA